MHKQGKKEQRPSQEFESNSNTFSEKERKTLVPKNKGHIYDWLQYTTEGHSTRGLLAGPNSWYLRALIQFIFFFVKISLVVNNPLYSFLSKKKWKKKYQWRTQDGKEEHFFIILKLCEIDKSLHFLTTFHQFLSRLIFSIIPDF